MRVVGDDGRELAANFDLVAAAPGVIEVFLRSAGGTSGTAASRNKDYTRALEMLLARFARLDALLVDCIVDSRPLQHLDEQDRRVHAAGWSYPVTLNQVTDFDALRRALSRPQARIGARGQGGGNERKRIRLTFQLAAEDDLRVVEEVLGVVEQGPRQRRAGVAQGVTADHVHAAMVVWATLGREAFLTRYGGQAAQRYVVPGRAEDMDALALLLGAREIAGLPRAGPWRGDRVQVADPLRSLGFLVDDLQAENDAPLGPDPEAYRNLITRFSGQTDALGLTRGRREQKLVRGSLGIASGRKGATALCAFCGRRLPEAFLVAAHLKPRGLCTEVERLDLPDVAVTACLLGCDALYERGLITINPAGRVLVSDRVSGCGDLAAVAAALGGRRVIGWSERRAHYAEWHRDNRFLAGPSAAGN